MIRFVKAHACGNDFLIVDSKSIPKAEQRKLAIRLCARHTGAGADGLEFLQWTGEREATARLYNVDGSIAEISGNGTRCVAAWMAREKRATAGDTFVIETDAGPRRCKIMGVRGHEFEIATAMGVPAVTRRAVTLASGVAIEGAVVSMGNPHFVIFVGDKSFAVSGMDWETVGREICFHPDFPQQTNVEFVRIAGSQEIEIRVFERGVGPTTSSGTGTCAAAAASIALYGLSAELRVRARGGAQLASWPGPSPAAAEMTLTGPAELICVGEAF